MTGSLGGAEGFVGAIDAEVLIACDSESDDFKSLMN